MNATPSARIRPSLTLLCSLQRLVFAASAAAVLIVGVPEHLFGQEANDAPNRRGTQLPGALAGSKPNFDKVGPQVGDQLPNLNLWTMEGEPQHLGDAWRGGPALLVTSSLTCPKSRSRWPELKEIVKKYGDKLNVVIVYVIEAHPVGSVCPYKGVEDVTPENERDGILRRQPTTLEKRLELAREFKRYLRISSPIYVDAPANPAWNALGAAPNIALLVNTDGIVIGRQNWFDGESMQKIIDKSLAAGDLSAQEERRPRRRSREENEAGNALLEKVGLRRPYEFRNAIRAKDGTRLARLLKQVPALANYVFPIEQGHNVETTALMQAVEDRNLSAAELLVATGADVHASTSTFDSALQAAAQSGQLEMARLLLRNHAVPSFPRTGKTPVHEAALAGHREVVVLLLEAGAPKSFFSDIALGDIDAVRAALAADPSLALRPDGADRMPMDYAAANGQVEIARVLLSGGAPVVEDRRSSIEQPLHRAIDRGDIRMVKLLLDAGTSPHTAVGRGGESPRWRPALHMAVDAKNEDIVKLLASKADLSARNSYSQTALHVAAAQGQADIADVLIRAGADVNARQLRFSLPCGSGEEETPSQNTPLHFAAARGNPRTIEVLLSAGAKIEARNVKGETPLMSTVSPPLYTGVNSESQLKNADALITAGANVNARDEQGETILDHAQRSLEAAKARNGRHEETQRLEELVNLLKTHGAKTGSPATKARRKARAASD